MDMVRLAPEPGDIVLIRPKNVAYRLSNQYVEFIRDNLANTVKPGVFIWVSDEYVEATTIPLPLAAECSESCREAGVTTIEDAYRLGFEAAIAAMTEE